MATQINHAELENIFAGIEGCSFVSLHTVTTPTLTGGKSNPQQGRIRKHGRMVVFCGGSPQYGKMVNKKAVEAYEAMFGDNPVDVRPFQPENLWKGKGEHVRGAVVRHNETDARYLMVYVPSNSVPTVEYTIDGAPIAKEDIVGLKPSSSKKSVTVDGVEVEVTIVPRTLKLSSVRSFKVNGEIYVVEQDDNGGSVGNGGQTVEPVDEATRVFNETQEVLRRLLEEVEKLNVKK